MKKLFSLISFISFSLVFLGCTIPYAPQQYPSQPPSIGPNPPPPVNPAYPPPPQGVSGPTTERQTPALPYDLTLDTLIASTCPYQLTLNGTNFTLYGGAFFDKGLTLSDDFTDNNNIDSRTTTERVKHLLNQSPLRTAEAWLSLQDESNLNTVVMRGNIAMRNLFPPLNNENTLIHLSQGESVFTSRSPNRRDVFSGGRFTSSLPLSGEELLRVAPELRRGSAGSGKVVTLTYTTDRNSSVRNLETQRFYGKEYKLEFEDPYKANYLTDIYERDLSNPSASDQGSWRCHEDLRFAIHYSTSSRESFFNSQRSRYRDNLGDILDEGYCEPIESASNLSNMEAHFFKTVFGTTNLKQLPFVVGKTVVQREYDGSDVRTRQTCIKPKTLGCYQPGGLARNFVRFEFDPEKREDCYPLRGKSFSSEDPDRYRICPAYLSACYGYHRDTN